MVIEPSLNLALVARILTGGISINFLLLFFAREDQVLDEAHAPVGEVVVVLVGIGSSDAPVLNGRVLARLENKKSLNYRNNPNYSGGLNTKHWNTERFEVQISDGSVLECSVTAIAIAMVPTILKPNHWKSEKDF